MPTTRREEQLDLLARLQTLFVTRRLHPSAHFPRQQRSPPLTKTAFRAQSSGRPQTQNA